MQITDKVSRVLSKKDFIFRGICRNATVIFLYHEISDSPSEFNKLYSLNVYPSIFEEQIKAIKKLFNVITPDELLSGHYPRPAAMITFDDGMVGYFERAVSILDKHQVPSVIFLNMGPVDGEIFFSGLVTYLVNYNDAFKEEIKQLCRNKKQADNYLYCTPEKVEGFLQRNDRRRLYLEATNFFGRLANRGHLEAVEKNRLVYFGNHLYNHYNAKMLSLSGLGQAYLENHNKISAFRNATPLFSYPFGQPRLCYDDATNDLIFKLGARLIFSSYPAANIGSKNKVLHRVTLNNDIRTDFDLKHLVMLSCYNALTAYFKSP